MSLEAETLRRLHRSFFPESGTPPEWFDRLAILLQENGVDVVDVVSYLRAMLLHEKGLAIENQSLREALRAPLGGWKHFGSSVTLVVPVTKSEAFLGQVLDFYDGVGVCPVLIVDEETSDEARSLLSTRGDAFIDMRGESRGDSLLSDLFARIDTDWILRLGDEELPTPALLNFVDKAVEYSSDFEWGFSRIQCRYDSTSGSLQYSQFLPYGPLAAADRQWRLIARTSSPRERRAAAPDAIILSLDWVVRSFAERIERLRAHEGQEQTAASLLPFHLHEAVPESWHMFTPLPGEQYVEFARQLYRSITQSQRSGPWNRDGSGEAS